MKRLIAILAAAVMVLSLTACFGTTTTENGATADEASADVDVAKYDKDFDGLQKYLAAASSDVKNATKAEIYYDILGADDGVRYVLNGNAFIELYDFSGKQNDAAKAILADIQDDGKFRSVEDAPELTAVITKSGKYVIAYDASRNYDYEKNIITDKVKNNW